MLFRLVFSFRYFKEKINELIQEKNHALANVTKYKVNKNLFLVNWITSFHFQELLQTHRSAFHRLGKVQSSGNVLTHKQGNEDEYTFHFSKKFDFYFLVQSLLKQSYVVPGTPETEHDLRSIAEALFENIKDKNVTITHQRKTNKYEIRKKENFISFKLLIRVLANRVAELEKLLAETNLISKSGENSMRKYFYSWNLLDQTSTLINLLDRTPTPPIPDSATSQFINSIDDQQQQTSPTQIFNFPSTWSTSPPLSNQVSEEEINNKIKGIKPHTPTLIKSTLECHQSRKISTKSDSIDLEMDDPLQSPTLTTSIAYLEERDLIPPISRSTSITERKFHLLNIPFSL